MKFFSVGACVVFLILLVGIPYPRDALSADITQNLTFDDIPTQLSWNGKPYDTTKNIYIPFWRVVYYTSRPNDHLVTRSGSVPSIVRFNKRNASGAFVAAGATNISFDAIFTGSPGTSFIEFLDASSRLLSRVINTSGSQKITFPGEAFQILFSGSSIYVDNMTFTIKDNTVPPPAPKLIFSGNDIVGTTQTVVVGQQIAIAAQFPASPAQSQQWLIAGQPIAGYTHSKACPLPRKSPTGPSCTGTVDAIQSASLLQPDIRFYWTVPGIYNVKYSYSLPGGGTGSVTTTFTVVGPSASGPMIDTTQGKIVLIDNTKPPYLPKYAPGFWFLACGNADVPGKPCVTFTRSRTFKVPSGYHGDILWVQKLLTHKIIFTQPIRPKILTCGVPANSLDESFPYNDVPGELSIDDFPNFGLAKTATTAAETFDADMYLMWKANLPAAIEVPLGHVRWSWKATANRTGTKWTYSAPAIKVVYKSDRSYPEWKTLSHGGLVACY